MKKEGKGYVKRLSDIEEYGLHLIHVPEDDKGPGFTYSTGLFHNYQHPEIIKVGLDKDLAHIVIIDIAFDIKQGKTFKSGTFYNDILDNFECLMIEVDKKFYNDYVGQGIRFYKNNDFPLLQCIYPTIKGAYPWEDTWPEDIKYLQPILGDINIEKKNIG